MKTLLSLLLCFVLACSASAYTFTVVNNSGSCTVSVHLLKNGTTYWTPGTVGPGGSQQYNDGETSNEGSISCQDWGPCGLACTGGPYVASGGTFTFGGPPLTWYTNKVNIRLGNSGIVPKTYAVQFSTNSTLASSLWVTIPSGAIQNYSFQTISASTNQVNVGGFAAMQAVDGSLSGVFSTTGLANNGITVNLQLDAGSGSLNTISNILGNNTDYTNFVGDYNPATNSGLALDETLRRVGSVLHSDLGQGFGAVLPGLQQLNDSINGMAGTAHSDALNIAGSVNTLTNSGLATHADAQQINTSINAQNATLTNVALAMQTLSQSTVTANANTYSNASLLASLMASNLVATVNGNAAMSNLYYQDLLAQNQFLASLSNGVLNGSPAPAMGRLQNLSLHPMTGQALANGSQISVQSQIPVGGVWEFQIPLQYTNQTLTVIDYTSGGDYAAALPSVGFVIHPGGVYDFSASGATNLNEHLAENSDTLINYQGSISNLLASNVGHTNSPVVTNSIIVTNSFVVTNNVDMSFLTNLMAQGNQSLQDINRGLAGVTNQLGGLMGQAQSNGYYFDGMWISTSNQNQTAEKSYQAMTNYFARQQTNFTTMSNLWSHFDSNSLFITNSFVFTNPIYITNQISIVESNQYKLNTNYVDYVAGMMVGSNAAQGTVSAMSRMQEGIGGAIDEVNNTTFEPIGDDWIVHIKGYGSGSSGIVPKIFGKASSMGDWAIDCNPMHFDSIAMIAAYCRQILIWLSYFGLLVMCSKSLFVWLRSLSQTKPFPAPSLIFQTVNVFAGNIPMTAIVIAVVLAVGTLPATACLTLGGYLPHIIHSPLSGMTNHNVSHGLWLLDQFFPIGLMITCLLNYYLFEWVMASLFFLIWASLTSIFSVYE